MATFTPAPVVASIRGTIGGVTFTRTRSGATCRARVFQHASREALRPYPEQTIGESRSHRRAHFTTISALWLSGLTQANRDSWHALATSTRLINRLGFPYMPTGRSLFIRNNFLRNDCGLAPIVVAPAIAVCQIPRTTLHWVGGPNTFLVEIYQDFLAATDQLLIWQSPARVLSLNVHTDPFYLHTVDDIQNFPQHLVADVRGDPWHQCFAYFFRVRALTVAGQLSHAIVYRTLSCA